MHAFLPSLGSNQSAYRLWTFGGDWGEKEKETEATKELTREAINLGSRIGRRSGGIGIGGGAEGPDLEIGRAHV